MAGEDRHHVGVIEVPIHKLAKPSLRASPLMHHLFTVDLASVDEPRLSLVLNDSGDATKFGRQTSALCALSRPEYFSPFYVEPLDDSDHPGRFAINFRFSEWGRKGAIGLDDRACDGLGWPVMRSAQLEENAKVAQRVIEHDQSNISTTQSSILNENRNPEMSRSENEEELNNVHADAEVTFIRPGVVVLSRPHPSALKTRMDIYEEIRDILQDTLDAKGRTFEVHVVDEPDPGVLGNLAYDEPATTYLNCYFVNGGLILSQFGDAQRVQEALALFRALCPNRVVQPVHVTGLPLAVGIDALAYRHTGGSIDPMYFVILD
ncbi:Peptidyl-arginine deiminase Porphyromonas-type [Penicillium chrysogenum]|nr:Peptidyl-arginine deiminase Porphyromonas-type [Penicillium chrysogenum]